MMSGFENNGPIPDWLSERFDQFTSLPRGPLEHFPVPVEGEIIRASSSAPSDGRPMQWTIGVECLEPPTTALTFYEEFLPLAGYTVVAAGVLRGRRNWFGRTSHAGELLVIQRGDFTGTVTIRQAVQPEKLTTIEVAMGSSECEPYSQYADINQLHQLTDVQWRHHE